MSPVGLGAVVPIHIIMYLGYDNWCLRLPSFESCIQQRKATCLLSFRKLLACARALKLTTTNMYITTVRCESQIGSEDKWAECSLIIGTGCWIQVFSLFLGLWVSIKWAFSGHWICWRISVWDFPTSNPAFRRGRQLVSFWFKNRPLCQSIEINMHLGYDGTNNNT